MSTTESQNNFTKQAIAPTIDQQKSDSKIWVMLPAFNEEVGVASLVPKLNQFISGLSSNFEIVIVDDASTDSTAQVISQLSFEYPVHMIQHAQNQGLAGALRTGLEGILEMGQSGDIVVTLDADDTQPPATIPQMLTMIHEGYDVVIASRYQPGSRTVGVPGNRLLMTWFAKWLFKIITPINGVWDYTCGFRAYRFDALQQSKLKHGENFVSEKGFSCMVDVLLKMRPFDFVMGEVPMLLRYDLKDGASKMKVAKTVTQTLGLLLKRRFGKFD